MKEDETTDCLAFSPADFLPVVVEPKRRGILGEIVICVDEVFRQAEPRRLITEILAEDLARACLCTSREV